MSFEEVTPEIPFKGNVCIIDTETGGFSPKTAPLLSLGVLIANEEKILDKREFKFAPPEGTFLEIPVFEDQTKQVKSKRIESWLNLSTRERIPPKSVQAPYLITAVAAEINGFVGASDTCIGWDFGPMDDWIAHGFSYEAGQEVIQNWFNLGDKPMCVATLAHNAAFDKRFVEAWLPQVYTLLPKTWSCTMQHFKNYHSDGGKKSAGLDSLCKMANYTPREEGEMTRHSALGDCYAVYAAWMHMRKLG